MKRFILILLGILLLLSGLLYWRMKWVESRYEGDYITLENEILLPDTDGKGFSDKVKKEINSKHKDPQLKKDMYKVSASYRQLARSKSFDEYRENYIDLLYKKACLLYLIEQKDGDYFYETMSELSSIFFDNQDMKDYIEFLEFFKYRNRDLDYELNDIIIKTRIKTEEDYAKKCNN